MLGPGQNTGKIWFKSSRLTESINNDILQIKQLGFLTCCGFIIILSTFLTYVWKHSIGLWYEILSTDSCPFLSKSLYQNTHHPCYFSNTGGSCSDTAAASSFSILGWISWASADLNASYLNIPQSVHLVLYIWKLTAPPQTYFYEGYSKENTFQFSLHTYQNHHCRALEINELINHDSSSL